MVAETVVLTASAVLIQLLTPGRLREKSMAVVTMAARVAVVLIQLLTPGRLDIRFMAV